MERTYVRKRLFAWVDPKIHNTAKAYAALSGVNLKDWVEQAVTEKIQREGGRHA
jgi:predicted HicB family RNase H-like nuclease